MTSSDHHRFPAHLLVPESGYIQALLWENPRVNYPRTLSWSFNVQFQRLVYRGQSIKPSLGIDWVKLPIRDWRDLVGTHLKGGYGFEEVEASFYVWEHDYADFELEVLERQGTRFRVRIALTVEFSGMDSSDRDPRLPVSTVTWLPFEGLAVPKDLVGEGASEELIRRTVEPFAELICFGSPKGGILPPNPVLLK